MDINGYKNVNPSLADYLGNGSNKTGYFDGVAQNLLSTIGNRAQAAIESASSSAVNVTLSEEAQKLLASGNKAADGKSAISGVQKAGQNFLMGFFDESGVDFENLSEDGLKLIRGLQSVISGGNATTRDISTDNAEMKYANGDKKVYTLVGDKTRLRLAIQYQDGQPNKLSVTDITGGKVETAEITLTKENGKPASINIDRTQREYQNGHMVTLADIDTLSVKL